MSFPAVRMRRLRRTPAIREMLQKVRLHPSELIQPMFVDETAQNPEPIEAMSGCYRLPLEQTVAETRKLLEQGIKAVLLFGVPTSKDAAGSNAYAASGIVQRASHKLKTEFGNELAVIADVCLCQYTSTGHCGIVKDNDVANDFTLEALQKVAVSQAQAGVDMVAPSAMMDGQVQSIRMALDDAGFNQVGIMAYSAKYSSSFYGPFRDAVESSPKSGNRKSYQMSGGSQAEALREIELDVNEGADVIMVKPALCYLDIIQLAKSSFKVPVAAYNVSGEYAMIKAAAEKGWINDKEAALEMLTGIKRAGADLIITYFAKEVVAWLKQF